MGMFDGPSKVNYGGSPQAQQQATAEAQRQMGLAQAFGNNALSESAGYNTSKGYGNAAAQRGQDTLAVLPTQPLAPTGGGVASARAVAAGYNPTAAINAATRVAGDQSLRAALMLGRSGANTALGMRQALRQQGTAGLQTAQQAQAMALQGQLQGAGLGMQAAGLEQQNAGLNIQALLAERQRAQQLGLGQLQLGMAGNQAATAQAAGLGSFREQLYSGRDMGIASTQAQLDLGYQQALQQQRAQQAGLVGGLIGAGGGLMSAFVSPAGAVGKAAGAGWQASNAFTG